MEGYKIQFDRHSLHSLNSCLNWTPVVRTFDLFLDKVMNRSKRFYRKKIIFSPFTFNFMQRCCCIVLH